MEVLDQIVTLKCRVALEPGDRLNAVLLAEDFRGVIEKLGGRCINPESIELGKPSCYYLHPVAVAFEPGTLRSHVTFYGPHLSAVSAIREKVQKAFEYPLKDTEIAGDISHG